MKKNEISIAQVCFKNEEREHDFETFLNQQNIDYFSYSLPLSYQFYRRPGSVLTHFIHVKEGIIVCYPMLTGGYSYEWLYEKKDLLSFLKRTFQNTADSLIKENISYMLHVCRIQLLFI